MKFTPPEIENFLPTLEISKNLTPSKFIEQHELTLFLKKSGVSDEQLQNVRFKKNAGDSFSLWRTQATHDWPSSMADHLQAWCTFRWLILENPPHTRDKDDAHRYLAIYFASPQLKVGLGLLENAQKSADKSKEKKLENAKKFYAQFQEKEKQYPNKNKTWLLNKTAEEMGISIPTAWRYLGVFEPKK